MGGGGDGGGGGSEGRGGFEGEIGLVENGDVVVGGVLLGDLVHEDRLRNVDILPLVLVVAEEAVHHHLHLLHKLLVQPALHPLPIPLHVLHLLLQTHQPAAYLQLALLHFQQYLMILYAFLLPPNLSDALQVPHLPHQLQTKQCLLDVADLEVGLLDGQLGFGALAQLIGEVGSEE